MGSLQRNLQNLHSQAVNRGIQQQAAMNRAKFEVNKTALRQAQDMAKYNYQQSKISNLANYVNDSTTYQPGQVYQYSDEGYKVVGVDPGIVNGGTTINVPIVTSVSSGSAIDLEALKKLMQDQANVTWTTQAGMIYGYGIDTRSPEDIAKERTKQKIEKKVNDIFNDLKNMVEGKPLAGKKFNKFAKKAFA